MLVLEGERRALGLHLLLWVTDSTEDAFSASENTTLKAIATLLEILLPVGEKRSTFSVNQPSLMSLLSLRGPQTALPCGASGFFFHFLEIISNCRLHTCRVFGSALTWTPALLLCTNTEQSVLAPVWLLLAPYWFSLYWLSSGKWAEEIRNV